MRGRAPDQKIGVGLHFMENDLEAWLYVASIVCLIRAEKSLENHAAFQEFLGTRSEDDK